jgi:sarcosine oxidase subunit alpha
MPIPSKRPAAWPASRRRRRRCDVGEAVPCGRRGRSALPGPDRGCKLVTAPVKGRKSFICFDEDATVKSVKQAIDKGFDVPELVKRFAGVGLGPGQGGIPGHNLPLFVAKYTASINTPVPTTVRPPLVPTFLATYAGYNHHMFKRTPLHDSQKADGGIFPQHRRLAAGPLLLRGC